MSDPAPRFAKEILEAIETLRSRKSRPSEPAIVKYVTKKYGNEAADIIADFDRLVDHEIIQKVDYKGSVSYRDTEKWLKYFESQQSTMVQLGVILNSQTTTNRIMEAVESLTNRMPDASMVELPIGSIEKQIQVLVPDCNLRGERLQKFIMREVDVGRVVQLQNGNFALATKLSPHAKIKRKEVKRPNYPESTTDTASPLTTRSAAKKTNGSEKPSEEDDAASVRSDNVVVLLEEDVIPPPPEPEEPPAPEIPDPIVEPPMKRLKGNSAKFPKFSDAFKAMKKKRYCYECVETDGLQAAKAGFLLECISCPYAGHPRCSGYSDDTVKLVKDSFTCMSCKQCKICGEGRLLQDAGMVLCVRCDHVFHLRCHNPPLTVEQAAKPNWKCSDCDSAIAAAKRKPFPANKPTSWRHRADKYVTQPRRTMTAEEKMAARVAEIQAQKKADKERVEKEMSGAVTNALKAMQEARPPPKTTRLVKDIDSWTEEDIALMFEKKKQPLYADVVRKMKIDGKALMLITRDDVIRHMGLRFVDAVKLHREFCLLCPFGPSSL